MDKVSKFFKDADNKSKIYIIMIITTIVSILLVGTYALIEWISSRNTELTFRIGDALVEGIVCSNENDITIDNMGPVFDYEESGEIVEFSVLNYTGASISINAVLNIDTISDNLKNKSFKYVMLASEDQTNYSKISEGNFENSNSDETILLLNKEVLIENTYYKIIFYIDGNQVNSNDIQSGSLIGSIQFCGEGLSDFKINNVTVDGEPYIGFPKGNYTVDIACNGAEATFDYETGHLKVSNITKSEEAKCTPTFTQNETTTYLDDHIASLKGTVSGTGEVVEEELDNSGFTPGAILEQGGYANIINDSSKKFTWDSTNKIWVLPTGSPNTSVMTFSPATNGEYQICYTQETWDPYDDYIIIYVDNVEVVSVEGKDTYSNCTYLGNLTTSTEIKVEFIKNSWAGQDNNMTFYLQSGTYSNNSAISTGIRYEGKNPNNYIRFNNEMWRIIGVFDTEVVDSNGNVTGVEQLTKIIRNNSIGAYVWDKNGTNTWPTSSLYSLLNNYYYNADDGQASGHCYQNANPSLITGHCDYTNTGIQDYYRPMISNVKWYLGGKDTDIFDVGAIYEAERSTSDDNYYSSNVNYKTANGYIGLMYVSDYGYSVLASSCNRETILGTTIFGGYTSDTCGGRSWLKKETGEWFITPASSNSSGVFNLHNNVGYSGNASFGFSIRPVLYLDSSVYITSGEGTESEPYIIAMD